MNKKVIGLGLAAVAALGLTACGSRSSKSSSSSSDSLKVAMVTDVGGIYSRVYRQRDVCGVSVWDCK